MHVTFPTPAQPSRDAIQARKKPLAYTRNLLKKEFGDVSTLIASRRGTKPSQFSTNPNKMRPIIVLKGRISLEREPREKLQKVVAKLRSLGIRTKSEILMDSCHETDDGLRSKLRQPKAPIKDVGSLKTTELTKLANRPEGVFIRIPEGRVHHIGLKKNESFQKAPQPQYHVSFYTTPNGIYGDVYSSVQDILRRLGV